ncbi:OmpH family outer membrane protein [Pelagicoccus sp. SDUM812003]|uniref:OmpH family outer membrane protein n=1 Tax=Pelagicoccus sp. SDUM812003 TaxID=3041267 RepID=UPI00280F2385|nr:OmpH family outer membrane protein [Pelagicoccus sp. SDUM812003]MDQ8203659.1 OmpH family outer membrane protein [Pelagicoccus sp. SDUM812003]
MAAATANAAEDVILTVKVDEALNKYYKVEQFLSEMEESETKAREKATAMETEINAQVTVFEELREQAQSDILTEEARKEAMQDGQAKAQEIQAKDQELRKFLSETQRQFAARRQQQLNLFYQDIAEVVNEISEERSATLVIDITARAGDGRAPVLYTDGSYDITPEVITRINATKGMEEEAAE